MSGTYSIFYRSQETGYDVHAEFAVDWDWIKEGEWTQSVKEGLGARWESFPGLDEEACRALLEHFGLMDFEVGFPKQTIIRMSPGQLAKTRREKEVRLNLPRKEMISDTIGNHVPAESYL